MKYKLKILFFVKAHIEFFISNKIFYLYTRLDNNQLKGKK